MIEGGLGSAVLEFLSDHNCESCVKRLGLPDKFIEHGKPQELYHLCGIDEDGILGTIEEIIKEMEV